MEVKMLLLEEDKNYQVRDVLDMFPAYFGMNVDELVSLLGNYEILSEEVICENLVRCPEKIWENRFYMSDMRKIIEERRQDYQIFKKNLAVLSDKAIYYLDLLQYMGIYNCCFCHEKEVGFYLDILSQLGIVLSKDGMLKGNELNLILIPLYHSISQFLDILNKVNCLETYYEQTYDSFARSYGEDKIYFTENVLLTDDFILDKTSMYAHHTKILQRK